MTSTQDPHVSTPPHGASYFSQPCSTGSGLVPTGELAVTSGPSEWSVLSSTYKGGGHLGSDEALPATDAPAGDVALEDTVAPAEEVIAFAPALPECPRPLAERVHQGTGEIIGAVPCRTWGCAYCGPRLKRSHVAHFTEQFKVYPYLYTATLTLDPKSVIGPPGTPYKLALVRTWTNAMKEVARKARGRREPRESYEHLGVVEVKGTENYHIHATVASTRPGLEEMIRSEWWKKGGGIVTLVEPVMGGPIGLAGWLSYSLKDHAYPGTRSHTLLTTKGTGYGAAEAREERKRHIEADPEGVILLPFEGAEDGPIEDRARHRGDVVRTDPALVDPDQRSRSFTRPVEGTPYVIQTKVVGEGTFEYAILLVTGSLDGSPLEHRVTVKDGFPSEAEAWNHAASLLASSSPIEDR